MNDVIFVRPNQDFFINRGDQLRYNGENRSAPKHRTPASDLTTVEQLQEGAVGYVYSSLMRIQ